MRETLLSPVKISILMFFHYDRSGDNHPMKDSGAYEDAVNFFAHRHCIDPLGGGNWKTNSKGRAWVESLCRVGEPELRYTDAFNILDSEVYKG